MLPEVADETGVDDSVEDEAAVRVADAVEVPEGDTDGVAQLEGRADDEELLEDEELNVAERVAEWHADDDADPLNEAVVDADAVAEGVCVGDFDGSPLPVVVAEGDVDFDCRIDGDDEPVLDFDAIDAVAVAENSDDDEPDVVGVKETLLVAALVDECVVE